MVATSLWCVAWKTFEKHSDAKVPWPCDLLVSFAFPDPPTPLSPQCLLSLLSTSWKPTGNSLQRDRQVDVAVLLFSAQEAVAREEARAGMEAKASLMKKIKEAEHVQRKIEARPVNRLAVVMITVKRTMHGSQQGDSPTNYLARSLEPLIRYQNELMTLFWY